MTTRIKFLGMAGYDILGPNFHILIDPFITGNPVASMTLNDFKDLDAILVSHAAYDHMGDAPEIALRTGAPVVCGGDVKEVLLEYGVPESQVHATVWGIVVKIGNVVVRPVESHHWSQTRLKSGQYVSGVPMGFIVETEPEIRIYHTGDTAIFGDMNLIGQLYQPTIGLLGCNNGQELLSRAVTAGTLLNGEMSPEEAGIAADFLGLKVAVASHYLDLTNEIERTDVEKFLTAVKKYDRSGSRKAEYLEVGQTLVAEGDIYRKE